MPTTKGVLMFRKTRMIALTAGVLAVVGLGGTALTSAGATPVGGTAAAKQTVERGAKQTPVEAGARQALSNAFAQPDEVNDTETADGGEPVGLEAGGGQEKGSETPGGDGPGGHADEPGNPNAEHEAGGQSEE
jgi:hypothetical protein